MNKRMVYFFGFFIISVPSLYLIYIWPSLPAVVPVHFGLNGKPDGFGNKSELILTTAIMSIISIGILFLLLNLHKIDPKKAKNSPGAMAKIAIAVIMLLSFLQVMIIQSALSASIHLDKFLLPSLGLLFAFLGNVFYSIKPNYFVGIRTPWTLESENIWRKTHQFAGKLWFGAGIFSMALSLFLPLEIAIVSFISITFIICLIPLGYSYSLYKKSQKTNS